MNDYGSKKPRLNPTENDAGVHVAIAPKQPQAEAQPYSLIAQERLNKQVDVPRGQKRELTAEAECKSKPVEKVRKLADSALSGIPKKTTNKTLHELTKQVMEGHTVLFQSKILRKTPPLLTDLSSNEACHESLIELLSVQNENGFTILFDPNIFLEVLPLLTDLSRNEACHESLIKLLSMQNKSGFTILFDPKVLREILPLLTDLSRNEACHESLLKLLSMGDKDGLVMFFYSTVFSIVLPLLTDLSHNMACHELLIKLLSVHNENGFTILFNPKMFREVLPLLTDVSRNEACHESLIKLFSMQDENRFTILFDLNIFSITFPLFVNLSKNETCQESLIKLFSAQNKDGCTVFFILDTFREILPLLKDLSHNEACHESLIKLFSAQNKNGCTILFIIEIFHEVLPLLTDLSHNEACHKSLIKLLSVRCEDGSTVISGPTKCLTALPLLKDLARNRACHESLIQLLSMQQKDGRTMLFFSPTVSMVLPLLTDLACNEACHESLIKLLSIQYKDGRTILFNADIFQNILPLLTDLARNKACHESLIKLLSVQNKDGRTVLFYSPTFSTVLPLLTDLVRNEACHESLIQLLSVQNKDGCSILFHSPTFSTILPLLTDLARNEACHESLIKLFSLQIKNGCSILFHPITFRIALPLLMDLVRNAACHESLIKLFSLQNKELLILFYDKSVFKNAIPLLKYLYDSEKHENLLLLVKILTIQAQDKFCILCDSKTSGFLVTCLNKLSENENSRHFLLELLTLKNKYGNTLLHNRNFFEKSALLINKLDIDLTLLTNDFGLTPLYEISKKWVTDIKTSSKFSIPISEEEFRDKVTQLKEWVSSAWALLHFGEGAGEINPLFLEINGIVRTPEEILLTLVNGQDGMLDKIGTKEAWLGTPPETDLAGLHRFYSEMLINFESIMNQLKEKKNPVETAGTLCHIASVKMEGRCCAAYQSEIRQKEMVLSGNAGSLDDIIKNAATSALMAVIEICMSEHKTKGDVHILNSFMYACGLVPTPDLISNLTIEDAQKIILDMFDLGLFMTSFKESVGEEAGFYLKWKTPSDFDIRLALGDGKSISYNEQKAKLDKEEELVVGKAKTDLSALLHREDVDNLFEALIELPGIALKVILEDYKILPTEGVEAAVFAYGRNLVRGNPKFDDVDLTQLIGDTKAPFKADFDSRLTSLCQARFPQQGLTPAMQMTVAKTRGEFKNIVETVRGMVLAARAFEQVMVRRNLDDPKKHWQIDDLEIRWKILEILLEYKIGLVRIADSLPKIDTMNPETDELEKMDVFKYFSFDSNSVGLPSYALEESRRLEYNHEWLGDSKKELQKILEINNIIQYNEALSMS
ncbi:MAG: hypothetical protein WCF65_04180 [Parachlamydiaceae bacterium]